MLQCVLHTCIESHPVIKYIFTISVNRDCGGYLTGIGGEITSLNYPNNYSNLMDCEWVISVEPSMIINLQIQEFDLEQSSNCMYDSLQVIEQDFNTS